MQEERHYGYAELERSDSSKHVRRKWLPHGVILRGKEFDVLRKENRERLEKQIGRTLVVHFGTECKTFSRARVVQ